MARFKGWTNKAIERLSLQEVRQTVNRAEKRRETARETQNRGIHRDYVGEISQALTIMGVEHVREYKFLHDRRFKFDLAIPEQKIAVEFEGGIFSGGRHTRGKGYANDAKKYNLATMHGWKLLRYTTVDTQQANWEFRIADKITELQIICRP
jgi:very-short-patch-repair endonuclease